MSCWSNVGGTSFYFQWSHTKLSWALTNGRYLSENGNYEELEGVLATAGTAVQELGETDRKPEMLAELAFHNSVQWQQRGKFSLSNEYADESLTQHHASGDTSPFSATIFYNHKSNVVSCLNRHGEA